MKEITLSTARSSSAGYFGRRLVRLWTDDGSPLDEAVDAIGHMPLPPYIKRDDRADDRDRYQTVFAQLARLDRRADRRPAFHPPLLDRAADARRGDRRRSHSTSATARFSRSASIASRITSSKPSATRSPAPPRRRINRARSEGRRVIAVGTTTTRTLEAVARANDGAIVAGRGETDLFLYPGAEFRVVGGLLTNFHLPQSSLLMLVSAFAGRERVRTAYDAAIAGRYRFYSYGDAMLIL